MASSKSKPGGKFSKTDPDQESTDYTSDIVFEENKKISQGSHIHERQFPLVTPSRVDGPLIATYGQPAENPTELPEFVTDFARSLKREERLNHLLMGKRVKHDRLIGFIRKGLPVSSVERVMKGLGIKATESLLPIIGMSSRTYARRKQSNQALTPLESDRLYRLAKIESMAEDVLGDKETANDWLQSPNRALGTVPLTLLDTEAGTEQVETVLTRIEHGVYS
jgi:putative toxin-antitoxin system antitoxin component (TIGR02293 family)